MTASIEVRQAQETMEGEGAEVKRLLPLHGFMNYDPIVLWDHFSVAPGTGFPDHPHRGFEGITYIFNGSMEHADNLGNRSTVLPGGAQRFTAGSGLVHSEMPGQGERTEGIQLWINLPKRLKTVAPAYQQVDATDFPEQVFPGGKRRILIGDDSPLKLLTPVKYLDIELEANASVDEPITSGHRGLVYIVAGEIKINDVALTFGQACFIDGLDTLAMTAIKDTRLMLCVGQPHGEPIRQYGPFVD